MKYIYLYTTDTYRLKNWYKIGESTSNPNNRVKSQDNASNPEPLLVLSFWQVDDNTTDKAVHKELEKLGFTKLRGNREWFELSKTPIEDVAEALITICNKPVQGELSEKPNIIIDIPHYVDLWWYKSILPNC
jgi:hypothetical protein